MYGLQQGEKALLNILRQLSELAINQFAGGYQAAKDLRSDANQQMVTARKLGATDADLQKARTDVRNAFGTMEAFTSRQEACNSMIGELAWSNNV